MDPYYLWDSEGLGGEFDEERQLLNELPWVLQLGSRVVRLGLAGVRTPHLQLSTPFLQLEKTAQLPVLLSTAEPPSAATAGAAFSSSSSSSSRSGSGSVKVLRLPDEAQLKHEFALWLREALGSTAARSLSERSLLLLETPLTPPRLKHQLADLLLNVFQVPGISFLSDLVAPLYTCGVDTGLVVDIGFSSCRVQPTCFGSPLPCALRISSGGAAAVLLQLQHELAAAAATPAQKKAVTSLGLEELEDMAIKLLYVRYDLNTPQQQQQQQQQRHEQQQQQQQKQRFVFDSDKALSYLLKDGLEITVPPNIRWRCAEVLFGSLPADEVAADVGEGLVELILSSLESCPSDARRVVLQNILLCGGFACCRGLSTRLASDLLAALKAHKRFERLAAVAALGLPTSPPAIRQWCGASLHASLAGLQMYGQSEWIAGVPLPDWASIDKVSSAETAERGEPAASASLSIAEAVVPRSPTTGVESQQQHGQQQEQQQQEQQQHNQEQQHVAIPKLPLQTPQRGPHLPKPPPPRPTNSRSSSSSESSNKSNGSRNVEGDLEEAAEEAT